MVAQQGLALLIKIDIDGVGDFQTIAGIRTRSITMTAEPVEITNSDSTNQWRELLPTHGKIAMTVTGSGVFLDHARDEDIRTDFISQVNRDFQLVVGSMGTFEGAFKITNVTHEGEYSGEVTYSITIESAGAFTFT